MTHTNLTPIPAQPVTVVVSEASIRAFVAEQSVALSMATVERYAVVVNALFEFLDTVDVEPRLGTEIARHLETARARLGPGAFLPTLGVVSMIRLLPDFLDDPWLPPAGGQRRSHRTVVDQLVTHLRRHLGDVGPVRDDLRRVRRAVRTARSRDYGHYSEDMADTGDVLTVASTFQVTRVTLDRMLDSVEEGRHASLDAAIEAWVDPERGDLWLYR
ncbi:hypothetical protein [Aeromicrobium sp. CF3.5]|uniref:hypothetical protein n=1 Tax=Aeromicrobium sp. CF3.5 TaxID=3373078 RepID=UPI003EE607E2